MMLSDLFIARAPVTEIMALEDAGILEQLDGAVDGGDRDVRIDGDCTAIKLLGVGMVIGFGDHARDHAALLGHAQALFEAGLFDPVQGFRPVHEPPPRLFYSSAGPAREVNLDGDLAAA